MPRRTREALRRLARVRDLRLGGSLVAILAVLGGVFDVDPGEALARCANPGELPFRIIGDAAVVAPN